MYLVPRVGDQHASSLLDLCAGADRASGGARGGLGIPHPCEAEEAAPLVGQLHPLPPRAQGLSALQCPLAA